MKRKTNQLVHTLSFFATVIFCHGSGFSQEIQIDFENVKTPTDASLRGLSVVNQRVIWASGSKQTVIHTTNAGKSWSIKKLPVKNELEFRDIEGFGETEATVLSAGSPGLVLQTDDGNKSWTHRYQNNHEKIFFDAFGFWNKKTGIAFSDPINGKLFLIKTTDDGRNWKHLEENAPKTLRNEAGFAASGTCLDTFADSHVWIGLGGEPHANETPFARVVYSNDAGKSWKASETTIPRNASSGIFSICFISKETGFAIGGDYKRPEFKKDNLSITTDGGRSWRSPKNSTPTGFRSCLTATNSEQHGWILVATGTNGTDVSLDLGETWHNASTTGFHAIQFLPGKTVGWASGSDGRVAKFSLRIQKTR